MKNPPMPFTALHLDTMETRRKALLAGLTILPALFLLIMLNGCAGIPAPTEQMALSTAAVGQAGKAGATEMAPAELQLAREKLDKAKLAMTKEDFDDARKLAEQAQVDAQLAEVKSRSGTAGKAAGELREGATVITGVNAPGSAAPRNATPGPRPMF